LDHNPLVFARHTERLCRRAIGAYAIRNDDPSRCRRAGMASEH
jgi:hypothetical protein